MMSATDYKRLHEIVFRSDYPGYRPEVLEIPNGDGKVDASKRYAHVAYKYLKLFVEVDEEAANYLSWMLISAHNDALEVSLALGTPAEFLPDIEYGALRVLEYPIGAGGEKHTDFDLLTLNLYRNAPRVITQTSEAGNVHGAPRPYHIGEIGAMVGLGYATPHFVEGATVVQHSIVYFAIPNHFARLPNGTIVRDWLAERMARSRIYK